MEPGAQWVFLSHGARRGFSGAIGLHRMGLLRTLITDVWCPPSSFPARLHRSFRNRFHPDLAGTPVHSNLPGLLAFEARCRLAGLAGWPKIHARNEWFQEWAVHELEEIARGVGQARSRPVLFSYSYTARKPFRFAKQRGWRTVLSQIDAGQQMQQIEQQLLQQHGGRGHEITSPPSTYWQSWREELLLADRIVVNSEWTRQTTLAQGVEASKIHVIPLSYEPPAEVAAFQRTVPEVFDQTRPLRALFLGQVTLLKGIMGLLNAMEFLRDAPVELHVAGPVRVSVPDRFQRHPAIHWYGKISRSCLSAFYRQADVFLFPTFCDGFGITQLEAQAWQVPVMSSKFCGDVVVDGVNGIRLRDLTAENIARTLRELAANPRRLEQLSRDSGVKPPFTPSAEAEAWSALFG